MLDIMFWTISLFLLSSRPFYFLKRLILLRMFSVPGWFSSVFILLGDWITTVLALFELFVKATSNFIWLTRVPSCSNRIYFWMLSRRSPLLHFSMSSHTVMRVAARSRLLSWHSIMMVKNPLSNELRISCVF